MYYLSFLHHLFIFCHCHNCRNMAVFMISIIVLYKLLLFICTMLISSPFCTHFLFYFLSFISKSCVFYYFHFLHLDIYCFFSVLNHLCSFSRQLTLIFRTVALFLRHLPLQGMSFFP